MIKKLYLFFIICILSFTGCKANTEISDIMSGLTDSSLVTSSDVINKNSGGEEKVICFKAYKIKRDIYYQFIENPQQNILDQQGNGTSIFMFSQDMMIINDQPSETIKCEKLSADPVEISHGDKNSFRLEIDMLLYDSFVNFIGDIREMKKYLKQNGITGSVANIALIISPNSPRTIWVVANRKNYFITIDEKTEDLDNPNEETYTYRMYKQSVYYEKFKMKNAKLIVKGKDITAGNYVKIHFSYADIPLKAMVEQLGGKVDWSNGSPEVFITYNNKKYIFNKDDLSIYEVAEPENIFIQGDFAPGLPFVDIRNGDIIVEDSAIRFFIKNQMGATINIDYDKLIINIE